MKYLTTLFLSFFVSEFSCAFIPIKLEDKRNLRTSKAKYYIVDGKAGKMFIKKFIAITHPPRKRKNPQQIQSGSDYSFFSNDKNDEVQKMKKIQTDISGSDYSIFSDDNKKETKKRPQPILSGTDYSLNIEVTSTPESEPEYYTPSAELEKDCEDMPKLISSNSNDDSHYDNEYDVSKSDYDYHITDNSDSNAITTPEPEPEPAPESASESGPEPEYYTPSPEFEKDCEEMPKLISSSDK